MKNYWDLIVVGGGPAGSMLAGIARKHDPKALLLDPKGNVGRLSQAKTTPHMFMVGKKGEMLYRAVIKTPKNYVATALDETLPGKPVSTSSSRPYGCSVKYKWS